MSIKDYETRKQEIFTSLQEYIPVTHSGMSPEEKLVILQRFADALLTTVFSSKHAQGITLHNLYYYFQEQAAGLGIGQDLDIQYAGCCLTSLMNRIRLIKQTIANQATLPAWDKDYEYLQCCEAVAITVAKLEITTAKLFTCK